MWYIHQSGNLQRPWKTIILGVKKAKISPQSPKAEFEAQNQSSCAISIDREFYIQSPTREFGAQNQYGCVQGRTGSSNFGGIFFQGGPKKKLLLKRNLKKKKGQ
jgi:hypothetical protein